MITTSITLFDGTRQYVLSTLNGQDWVLPPLDARNLYNLPSSGHGGLCEIIPFDKNSNGPSMHWTGNVGYFTHSLNCLPSLVAFYDSDGKTVLAEAQFTSPITFTVDFQDRNAISGTWVCIVQYGAEVGSVVSDWSALLSWLGGSGEESSESEVNSDPIVTYESSSSEEP